MKPTSGIGTWGAQSTFLVYFCHIQSGKNKKQARRRVFFFVTDRNGGGQATQVLVAYRVRNDCVYLVFGPEDELESREMLHIIFLIVFFCKFNEFFIDT